MSAHQPSTARRPFAARRLAARVGAGLLALAGCLLLAGLPFGGPAPAHRSPTAATLLAEPAAAGKAPASSRPASDETMERVEAADAFPLTAVVRVEIKFPDGAGGHGSGAMIDRFHVLTAGHCVYSSHHGGWAEVSVSAGQTGSTKPFEVAHSVKVRTFDSFINDDKASKNGEHVPGDGDVGLITLDRPLGDETGTFAFGYNDDDEFFNGRTLYQAGYPGKPYNGQEMYAQHGPILGARPGTADSFGYLEWDVSSMTAIPGQSGSGVYDVNEETGQETIYAVLDLHGEVAQKGYAERITKDVFDAIQGWVAEDGQPDAPNGPDAPDAPDAPDGGDNP